MIARTWQGWAAAGTADDYQRHYETAVTEHLRAIPGFVDVRLLRHADGGEVMFTSIVTFRDMAAVHAFAGDRPDLAVVEEDARRALLRWDDYVVHHDVAVRHP